MQMSLSASCGPEEREQECLCPQGLPHQGFVPAPFIPFGLSWPTAEIAVCEQRSTRQKNALFLCFLSLQFLSLKAQRSCLELEIASGNWITNPTTTAECQK